MASKHIVYTFKDVSLTIDGIPYFISSMQIVLQENGIPEVNLTIDPHPLPDTERAVDATFEFFAREHKILQQAAIDYAPASLTITAEASEGGDTQTLELSDWVVTGAGVGGVSASGGFGFKVRIQHKIALADAAVIIGSVRTDVANKFNLAGTKFKDVLDGFVKSIEAYSKLERTVMHPVECGGGSAGSTPSSSLKRAVDAMASAANVLKNNIESSVGLPLDSCKIIDRELIANTIPDYVVNFTPETSIWQLFIGYVTDHFSLSLKPTIDKDKLKLVPAEPWAKASITINADDVSDLDFPSVDPAPVMGVAVQYQEPGADIDHSSSVYNKLEESFSDSEMIYMPGGEAKGRIVRLHPPCWAAAIGNKKASSDGQNTVPDNAEAAGKLISPSNNDVSSKSVPSDEGGGSLKNANIFLGVIYACAQQQFLITFRQQVGVLLQTRLMFSTKAGLIVPGNVCSFKSSEGTTVFDFYVTDVVHVIDCQGSTARTEISGRYVRPEKGFPGIVEPGTKNPLY